MYDTMSYFMRTDEDDTKLFALKAIGSICIRHYDFMLCQDLMNMYLDILSDNSVANIMKSQVCDSDSYFALIIKNFSLNVQIVFLDSDKH